MHIHTHAPTHSQPTINKDVYRPFSKSNSHKYFNIKGIQTITRLLKVSFGLCRFQVVLAVKATGLQTLFVCIDELVQVRYSCKSFSFECVRPLFWRTLYMCRLIPI